MCPERRHCHQPTMAVLPRWIDRTSDNVLARGSDNHIGGEYFIHTRKMTHVARVAFILSWSTHFWIGLHPFTSNLDLLRFTLVVGWFNR
jgi:hypothetical protein